MSVCALALIATYKIGGNEQHVADLRPWRAQHNAPSEAPRDDGDRWAAMRDAHTLGRAAGHQQRVRGRLAGQEKEA